MRSANERLQVIDRIKEYAEAGDFYRKVEPGDPVLTPKEAKAVTDRYLKARKGTEYKIKRAAAVKLAKIATKKINKDTVIIGTEKIPADIEGAIITSNHFGPLENTVIRRLTQTANLGRLNIISQVTNFAMTGAIGFLMNYADTIPISSDPAYLARDLVSVLKEKLIDNKETVLLYPEQEMWFNYRKPRPPKRGAYYFAAKLGVPVISCFVQIVDCGEDDGSGFRKTKYILHVLDVLYPDTEKTVKENSLFIGEKDYALKKECYERVYGKKLTYKFECCDIAGWCGKNNG